MTTFRARSAFAIAATIGLSAILTFGPAPAMAATAVGARLAAANGVYLQEDCDGDGLDDDTGLPIAPPAAPTPTPTQAAPSTQAPPPPDTGASSGGGADTGSASAGSGGEPPSGGSSGGEGAAPPPAAPTEQAPAPAPTPTAKAKATPKATAKAEAKKKATPKATPKAKKKTSSTPTAAPATPKAKAAAGSSPIPDGTGNTDPGTAPNPDPEPSPAAGSPSPGSAPTDSPSPADSTAPPSPASQTTTALPSTLEVSGTLRVGGELTVAASGLTRGATPLNLVINSDSPVNLAQIDSAPDGSFAVAVTLPATLPPGEHVLAVLHNGVTLATAPVTLAPKPASNLVEALGAGFSGGADARGEVTAGFAALGLLAFASVAALGLQRLRRRRPAVKGPRA